MNAEHHSGGSGFSTSREFALALDRRDPLAGFREEFLLPSELIYLDGNSLGPLSRRAEHALIAICKEWRALGIDGWTSAETPWFRLSETLGAMTAPLLGAHPDEVVVTGSTTVNLHQLVATFYAPQGDRTRVLASALDFPSDIHALKSQISIRGLDPHENLILIPSRDGRTIDEEDVIASMTSKVALVILPTVLYRSGQLLDIVRLSAEARKRNIVIGFDAAHSIGAIPHRFTLWELDFAVWCNYKYLNGGPGAVAGLYVNRRHFGAFPGLAGWFGSRKEDQFAMLHDLHPAYSAGAYQIGTPHLLSLAPLVGSLGIYAEAGIDRIRQKSLRLTRYLVRLIHAELAGLGCTIGTPLEDHRRGGHIALEHHDAVGICQALRANGIVTDYRPPNIVRLTPAALYVSYEQVWRTVRAISGILRENPH